MADRILQESNIKKPILHYLNERHPSTNRLTQTQQVGQHRELSLLNELFQNQQFLRQRKKNVASASHLPNIMRLRSTDSTAPAQSSTLEIKHQDQAFDDNMAPTSPIFLPTLLLLYTKPQYRSVREYRLLCFVSSFPPINNKISELLSTLKEPKSHQQFVLLHTQETLHRCHDTIISASYCRPPDHLLEEIIQATHSLKEIKLLNPDRITGALADLSSEIKIQLQQSTYHTNVIINGHFHNRLVRLLSTIDVLLAENDTATTHQHNM